MRISDWSSDVCSSDLNCRRRIRAERANSSRPAPPVKGPGSGAANICGSRTGCLHGYAMTRFAASLLSLSITLALSPAFAAQPADAPAFDPQRLSEMVKTLSADDFEGRGPATAGEKKTIDYVTAPMQAAGVQPGGDVQEDEIGRAHV